MMFGTGNGRNRECLVICDGCLYLDWWSGYTVVMEGDVVRPVVIIPNKQN